MIAFTLIMFVSSISYAQLYIWIIIVFSDIKKKFQRFFFISPFALSLLCESFLMNFVRVKYKCRFEQYKTSHAWLQTDAAVSATLFPEIMYHLFTYIPYVLPIFCSPKVLRIIMMYLIVSYIHSM